MIETKEEYEFIARQVFGGRDWRKLNETIEALRKAVWMGGRAIEYLQADPQSMETQATIMQWEDARDALPDWLVEE
jgi:hypothetical protein